MSRLKAILVALMIGAVPSPVNLAWAGETVLGPVTNLPVPRYVSLRSSEINVRRGPGLDYRKDWVFRRAGLPVQVVEEYGDWRRIVDKDQTGGWVYHAMITGRRTVVITGGDIYFRERPTHTAAATAMAEQGVVARLRACQPDWCQVEKDGYRGWVPKAMIWGVDPTEVLGE
ncbi:MAG: SH3 domain-containing protein [Pseudomonadota bacterium]